MSVSFGKFRARHYSCAHVLTVGNFESGSSIKTEIVAEFNPSEQMHRF